MRWRSVTGARADSRTGLVNAKKRTDIMHALFGVSNVDGCRTSGFDRFPVGYDHKCLAVVGGWQVLEVAIERNNDLESQFIVISINGDTIYSHTDTNSFFSRLVMMVSYALLNTISF